MYNTPKRFPPVCRFYSQGTCRAGQNCNFAHVLPFGDKANGNSSDKDPYSIQKAIRDLEVEQVEKKYKANIKKTTNYQNHTSIELALPLESDKQIEVHLVIPYNYPDLQCTLQIYNLDLMPEIQSKIQTAFEDDEWHQMKHKTLIQQLDWLITHFNKFIS
ncbi:hypothetical protein BCV72DRAFT_338323 [Rhizopus microsporus var. microsporus]|uniref:C3H1-type domain-containing protein n=1 Tax=Rhizopus microsporus var. microsporus TaxID=86635 RepID=A0A1X0QTB1_RHIZD|nr:hypothetical protein BCV72DRAFT_338323 [Rhizopus microsporus var. microsporus]